LLSRDRGEGCATGQPQGIGSEAYLNSTSQDPILKDARKDVRIHGRSRQSVKYPGYNISGTNFIPKGEGKESDQDEKGQEPA
jgi:hypothetical protein